MSAPLLAVAHLARAFGRVEAVRDVSFEVGAGEIVAMIGPNGAGKTTCFNLIHGQLSPDAGEVRFAGRPIVGLPTHVIARRGVGRTFQTAATFVSMTVRESVALAHAAAQGADARVIARRLDPAVPQVDEALSRLHLDGLADAHCATLAYGDAKRLELALALAGSPKLLLMDEPTAGMAPADRRALMAHVVALAQRDTLAVLFTEHDMDVVFGFAGRVIVLDNGEVIAEGTPGEVRGNAAVRAAYLGYD